MFAVEQMRTFIVEFTCREYGLVEIEAATMESAQGKVKDGQGRWIHHPSRLLETKIIREISTEELAARKKRS